MLEETVAKVIPLLPFLAVYAFAQSAATPVPNSILYETLFMRVVMQKNFAAEIARRHLDNSAALVALQKEIGLTDDEYNRLETIAIQAQAAKDAYFAQREQIMKSPLSDARRAQYMKNEADDQSRSVNEIQRLLNALGDAAFQKVDAYARREILPHIGYQNLRQQQGGKQQ